MGRKITRNQYAYKYTEDNEKDSNMFKDSASLDFAYKSDDLLLINKNNTPLNQLSAEIILSNSQKIILICTIILQLILIRYYDFLNIIFQFFHLIVLLKYGVIVLKSTNRI
ncbi:hypothetical protein [Rickettsiales endosymbiont of Trichoplax sp. H2]|uniref:hypothetical protein n=1 Tax=Rickettsiales endosymbiont of Trichoplax sp. H2 TaxID=2021221 RepID=UPI0012B3028E|nr:hypothetical protein [Rickettsiales endosymbiont of Trichoplax sp. H2]MSO13252.1 hypothetical protein [Rickettsiales endosymbiont of Trichoplax sp. H2]